MASLNPFNLDVEIAQPATGMARAVLLELLEHLKKLHSDGTTRTLDLLSLPLSPVDRNELENTLGQGEIHAVMSNFGESKIQETRYSGIWWIKHFTEDGALISELIEITLVPDILLSQHQDIGNSIQRLEHELAGDKP